MRLGVHRELRFPLGLGPARRGEPRDAAFEQEGVGVVQFLGGMQADVPVARPLAQPVGLVLGLGWVGWGGSTRP